MSDDRTPMANIPPFGLRMQPDLKARVEEAARANNRSLNAEIVAVLAEKYPPSFSVDEEEFVARWVDPLLDSEYPSSTFDKLLAQANAAAARVHPSFGVWVRARASRIEIVFGVRDKSLLPRDTRDFLNSYFVSNQTPKRKL